jgi:Holliday junction DNA helicase RuvA
MIAYIRGTLIEKNPTRAVVEAAGVGYEILIPVSTYDRLPRTGDEVKLSVRHIVREDDETLFGFATESEKTMFVKLTGVSGVGPKIALQILSGSSIGELSMAIAGGNAKRISAIKGVGKKTAEKICVELKDKVSGMSYSAKGDDLPAPARPTSASAGSKLLDAESALEVLGYSRSEIQNAIRDIDASQMSVEDIIRLCIAKLT